MGRYFKSELSQNLKNSCLFFDSLQLATYFAMSWQSSDFIRQISSKKSRAKVLQVGFKLWSVAKSATKGILSIRSILNQPINTLKFACQEITQLILLHHTLTEIIFPFESSICAKQNPRNHSFRACFDATEDNNNSEMNSPWRVLKIKCKLQLVHL